MKRRLYFRKALFVLGVVFVCLITAKVLTAARRQAGKLPENVIAEKAIAFGRGGDQTLLLDLTRPKKGKGPFPALVFVHGGGWAGGRREDFMTPMYYYSQKGFVCITVDYRLAPKYKFPAQIEDVKCAVRWLRANAQKYEVDTKRIGAVGASAGAHLVALLGTTANQKRWEGSGGNAKKTSAIRAMICLSGPYDLTRGYRNSPNQKEPEGSTVRKLLEQFLGGTPDTAAMTYRAASPISFASKSSSPALLLHGTADTLVLIEQSDLFYAKLKSVGAAAQLMRVEGAGHVNFGSKTQEVVAACDTFLQKHLIN